MAEFTQACALLRLPREARDLIYLNCMQLHIDRPRVLSTGGTNQLNKREELAYVPRADYPALPLLGVSRQVRAEVLALYDSLSKQKRINFTLHLLVGGYQSLQYWSYLTLGLRPASRINTLTLDLTIRSTENFVRDAHWPWRPSQVMAHLLHYLNQFLFFGPSFMNGHPTSHRPGPHYVETLLVKMQFQDDYTPATWPRTVDEVVRAMRALAGLKTADRFFGKIIVKAEYSYQKKDVKIAEEWQVNPDNWDEDETLRNDRRQMEKRFGDFWRRNSWARFYPFPDSIGESTPG